jgi:hypothetical protein
MANFVFDCNYKNTTQFGLQNISGVDYIDQYSDRGKDIAKHQQLANSTLRPYLDPVLGVRFQDNNFSVLMGQAIAHKQAYILFNCLQAGGVYRSSSNPIYTARHKSPNISRVFGQPGQKRINSFMHTNGFLCYSPTTKIPLTDLNNADPIENYRLLVVDFNAVAESVFILGGGSSSPTTFLLRSLNGYVKRCILLDDVITGTEQDDLIAQIFLEA